MPDPAADVARRVRQTAARAPRGCARMGGRWTLRDGHSSGRTVRATSDPGDRYEEGWELLDAEARRYLNMSGEELVRRWDAGEIAFNDPVTHSAAVQVWMLLAFVREECLEG